MEWKVIHSLNFENLLYSINGFDVEGSLTPGVFTYLIQNLKPRILKLWSNEKWKENDTVRNV